MRIVHVLIQFGNGMLTVKNSTPARPEHSLLRLCDVTFTYSLHRLGFLEAEE